MSTNQIFLLFVASILFGTGCKRSNEGRTQGYVEGEFVYIAAPVAGALAKLEVVRGGQVKEGTQLFTLENTFEISARDEAARRVTQSRATLEDVKKGKRPSEIAALEAQLKETRASQLFAEKQLARQEMLSKTGVTMPEEMDRARSNEEQTRQRLSRLEAELQTALLGARSDQIAAAEAEVHALEAMLVRAEWMLGQKKQLAPQDALVFDTLYREGEWVASGKPVIALLPPQNIKLRFFVPEAKVAAIQPGAPLRVWISGLREPLEAKVSFISPQAEYTPPVIYSAESRSKLVFMIEAVFAPEIAAKLHPGQPVDVALTPSL